MNSIDTSSRFSRCLVSASTSALALARMPTVCATLRLSLLLLPISIGAAAHAQTASYTFDSGSADFQANFNRNSQNNSTNWSYLTTGGIGGSGAVQSPGAFSSDAVFLQALPNTPGTTITLSLYGRFGNLQTVGFPTTYSGDAFGIGLVSSTSAYAATNGGSGAGSGSSLLSYLNRQNTDNGTTATATGVALETDAFQGANNKGIIYNNNANTVTVGDWYRITDTISVQSGTLQISTLVADYGPSATAANPTTLISNTGTVTNPFTGSNFYAAIYGGTLGGNVSGASALDNFSQVAASSAPEPAALALLLPAMLPFACRTACRRRKTFALRR